MLHDDRPGEGRDQRVLALVLGVRLEGRHGEVGGELLLTVDHHRFHRAGGECTLLDGVPVPALTHVGGHADHLDPHLLLEPLDGDGGVKPSAVGEDDALGHGRSALSGGSRRGGGRETCELSQAGSDRRAARVGVNDDDHGVVASDGAEHVGDAGAVEGGCNDVRGPRWGAEDHEVG